MAGHNKHKEKVSLAAVIVIQDYSVTGRVNIQSGLCSNIYMYVRRRVHKHWAIVRELDRRIWLVLRYR